MKQHHNEPQPPATLPANNSGPNQSTTLMASARHDGWTGEKMAIFCETLAETAVVAEACEEARMGISGAYAARRRDPVFAAAWDAALSIARERLADTLLGRAMEGNVEQIYRDGELVGERHVLDNRLGLAILRRLDRLAETGQTVSTRGERHPFPREGGGPAPGKTAAVQRLDPGLRRGTTPIDWTLAVEALRAGDSEGVARGLALFQGNEVEEVEDPPVSLSHGDDSEAEQDQSDRCWWDEFEECWMTDFPPPPGFDGYETRAYHDHEAAQDEPYRRGCTPEEVAVLEADRTRAHEAARGEDEERRDAWFALLKADAEDEHGELSS